MSRAAPPAGFPITIGFTGAACPLPYLLSWGPSLVPEIVIADAAGIAADAATTAVASAAGSEAICETEGAKDFGATCSRRRFGAGAP